MKHKVFVILLICLMYQILRNDAFLFSDIHDLTTIINKREKPKILVPPQNLSVIANQPIILVCVAEGNPKPKLQWTVNGQHRLPNNYRIVKRFVLRITNAYPQNNKDIIVCQASNVMGTVSRTAHLTVLGTRNTVSSGFPQYLGKSSIILSQKDSNITLECLVIGDPIPKIIWFRDFYPIDMRNKRFRLKNGRNLFIINSKENDSGKYQCLGFNNHGSVLSSTMNLMVRISRHSPHFVYVTPDQAVTPGASVKLRCSAEGSPIPSVYWVCGGTRLSSSRHPNNPDNIGTIITVLSDISEPLNCTCMAVSAKESANHTVHISIKNIPSFPNIIGFSSITTTDCIVTWSHSATSFIPVNEFTIFYVPTSDLRKKQPLQKPIEISHRESIDPSLRISTKLDRLLPYTNYSVWLIAIGGDGASDPSVIRYFKTSPSVPASSAQNIQVIQLTRTSVKVDWSTPDKPNGKIIEYKVLYSTTNSTNKYIWLRKSVPITPQPHNPHQSHTLIISNLHRNTRYYFQIQCLNTVGYGPGSRVLTLYVNDNEIFKIVNCSILSITQHSLFIRWLYSPQARINHFAVTATAISLSHQPISVSKQQKDLLMVKLKILPYGTNKYRNTNKNMSLSNQDKYSNTEQVDSQYHRLNWYYVHIPRLIAATKYSVTIMPVIKMMKNSSMFAKKLSITTKSKEFKPQFTVTTISHSALLVSMSDISSSSSSSALSNTNSSTNTLSTVADSLAGVAYKIQYQRLSYNNAVLSTQENSENKIPVKCVLGRQSSCQIINLDFKTIYRVYIHDFKNSQIAIKYGETWPAVPESVRNLQVQLKCNVSVAPCIRVTWDYFGHQPVIFNVRYAPTSSWTTDSTTSFVTYAGSVNVSDTEYQTPASDTSFGMEVKFNVTTQYGAVVSRFASARIQFPEKAPSQSPRGIKLIWDDQDLSIIKKSKSNTSSKYLNDILQSSGVSISWEKPSRKNVNGMLKQTEIVCKRRQKMSYSVAENSNKNKNDKVQSSFISPLGKFDKNKNENSDDVFRKTVLAAHNSVDIVWKYLLNTEFGAKCYLRFWNNDGAGPWSDAVLVDPTIRPLRKPPDQIRALKIPGCCLKVTWKWKTKFISDYSHFIIQLINNNTKQIEGQYRTKYPTSFLYLENVNNEQDLSVSVRAVFFNQEFSQWSPSIKVFYYSAKSPIAEVSSLECSVNSSRSIVVGWSYRADTKYLLHFRINFTGITDFLSPFGKAVRVVRDEKEDSFSFNGRQIKYYKSITGLHPYTTYTFSVEPVLRLPSRVWSVSNEISCITKREAPNSILPPTLYSINRDKSVINLLLHPASQDKGSIKVYYIIVATLKERRYSTATVTATTENRKTKFTRFKSGTSASQIDINDNENKDNNERKSTENAASFLTVPSSLNDDSLMQWLKYKIIKNPSKRAHHSVQSQSQQQQLNMNTVYCAAKIHKMPGKFKLLMKKQKLGILFPLGKKKMENSAGLLSILTAARVVRKTSLSSSSSSSSSSLVTAAAAAAAAKAKAPVKVKVKTEIVDKNYSMRRQLLQIKNELNDEASKKMFNKTRKYDNLAQTTTSLSAKCINYPLNIKQVYRAMLIACIEEPVSGSDISRICTASDWSLNLNHVSDNLRQSFNAKENEERSYLINIILASVFIPSALCFVAFIITIIIRRKSNNVKIFQSCVKRPNTTDYFGNSTSEMKENLVNPLISTGNTTSFIIPHNEVVEFKMIHKYPTPDLLVQSSPSTSMKVAYKGVMFPSDSKHKIPIGLLHEYISHLKLNECRGFSAEFHSINHVNEFSSTHSNSTENKSKNRYANIVAYDHSRVVLQNYTAVALATATTEDRFDEVDSRSDSPYYLPTSDYINANYIDGYRNQNAYIATQGPLTETLAEFWQMVWEQRSSVIVMLTHLVERSRVKCEQYWPKGSRGANCRYGNITVTVGTVIELAYFILRSLTVQKSGCSEKREIKHFQFTAWPDHGVPYGPIPFLMFVNKIKKDMTLDSGPIIAHCSSGVGRTGVYIAVDAMIEQMKHKKSVDVYSYVSNIRTQRNYMVQTEEQYIFIHDVLLDHLHSIHSEIFTNQLYSHIDKLHKLELESSGFIQISGFQVEFRRLLRWSAQFPHIAGLNKSDSSTKSSDSVSCLQECYTSCYETAMLSVNQSKNKSHSSLPPEFTRVLLRPIKNIEGSDYINASWIDSHCRTKAFIATQSPLKETIEDFWRMLWEYNCGLIINLQETSDNCQYWPTDRSVRYQFFVVDPVSEYEVRPHYILREFKLTDARDGQTRMIRQFQFIGGNAYWGDDYSQSAMSAGSSIMSTESFLELIEQVQKTQAQFGQNGPIIIHCGTGSSKTGLFLALSILIERIKLDQTINVFEVFKLLKWQRPSLINGEDQYQFCYAAILEYLTLYSDDPNN